MPYKKRGSRDRQKPLSGTRPSGKSRDATILFVDVVGCSEIANHLTPEKYKLFIKQFQDCFKSVCENYKNEAYDKHEHVLYKYETRGDEGCLKIFVGKKDDELARDIDVAISIALDLKRMWLLTDFNEIRINGGLLPVDLTVGIHFGQVYVEDGDAEGYAVNLAKRIESHSREGDFTHILLSEAAYGQLDFLMDELIYKFSEPFVINPKGISHAIRVFEIKHHYLPTDWQDTIDSEPLETSMVFKEHTTETIKIIDDAYKINPTNLWLAEFYISVKLVDSYRRLSKSNLADDPDAQKEEYAPVLSVVRRIANNVLVDATLLLIWGQVFGEMGDYDAEEKRYSRALKLDPNDGNIRWYLGLCLSYQLKTAYDTAGTTLKKFYDVNQPKIEKVLKEYEEAIDLKPMNPVIVYDYACELSHWSRANKDFKKEAVKKLIDVLKLDPDLKYWAKEEDYFKPIIDDPQIKKYLK